MNEREHYAIQELYEENVFVTHGLCLASMHKMPNLHFHDGFEIFLSMSDGCVFSFEEKSYRLDRGGLILANNRELHRTFAPPEGMTLYRIWEWMKKYFTVLLIVLRTGRGVYS